MPYDFTLDVLETFNKPYSGSLQLRTHQPGPFLIDGVLQTGHKVTATPDEAGQVSFKNFPSSSELLAMGLESGQVIVHVLGQGVTSLPFDLPSHNADIGELITIASTPPEDIDTVQTAIEALGDAIEAEASARTTGDSANADALAELQNTLDALGISDIAGLIAALAAKADLIDGFLPLSQIPVSLLGGLRYWGTWDASTNTPAIPLASSGNQGRYYRVAVAGSTSISGINDWGVGDWIVSNGASWDKIDNSEVAHDDLTTTAQDPSNGGAVGSLRSVLSNLWAAITGKADRALSNLSNLATARSNLGLGGAAILNVGTATGTVAAGDDARIFDDNLFLVLTGGTVVLSSAQCRAKNIYLSGTLAADAVLEFLNLNRTWNIYDGTTRAGFKLYARKTSGANTLIYPGEAPVFYLTGS